MATVRTYWNNLYSVRDIIAAAMGVDTRIIPQEMRAESFSTMAVMAALVKALIENGVLTAEQFSTALTDALGADGSTWDLVQPPEGVVLLEKFDTFGPENFEGGSLTPAVDGAAVDQYNSYFDGGPVHDLTNSGTVSAVFDASQHYAGSFSMKTVTNDGASIAVRTATFRATSKLHVRFYFRATAAPASTCRIYAAQFDPASGGSVDAERWSFEVGVDSSGHPVMFDNGIVRAPGSTPPNICDGTWWRIEAAFGDPAGQCEIRLYGGADVSTTNITFSWTGAYTGGTANAMVLGQPKSSLTTGQSWTAWYDDVDVWVGFWLGP